jgi:hypothetical protein
MKNASAIAERLQRDLDEQMRRLTHLAVEIRQHIHQPTPDDRIDDLRRVGRELSAHLQRLRESTQR